MLKRFVHSYRGKYFDKLLKKAIAENTNVEKLINDVKKQQLSSVKQESNGHTNNNGVNTDYSLNSLMDVSKLARHNKQEIESLFALNKKIIPGKIEPVKYAAIYRLAHFYPQFLVPLENREKGVIDLFFSQFIKHLDTSMFLYTPLSCYKALQSNSVPSASWTMYTDLLDKETVLTSVWHDKTLDDEQATRLSKLTALFYTSSSSRKLELLKQFAAGSDKFNVDILIDEYNTID